MEIQKQIMNISNKQIKNIKIRTNTEHLKRSENIFEQLRKMFQISGNFKQSGKLKKHHEYLKKKKGAQPEFSK